MKDTTRIGKWINMQKRTYKHTAIYTLNIFILSGVGGGGAAALLKYNTASH